ncbi:hypothetical protein GSI_04933 [Ganoderma sinense ZZ0214-1]|uniref:Uncharacterized protein n=1 Tax=Ganoderma sinense ZZ0214-1 TaxID=1077348 RepID=A0A2G8SGC1_9APHY|nr:hypothetical protein GSI_04933 [Ganoderma sinense ZZ0214-1]
MNTGNPDATYDLFGQCVDPSCESDGMPDDDTPPTTFSSPAQRSEETQSDPPLDTPPLSPSCGWTPENMLWTVVRTAQQLQKASTVHDSRITQDHSGGSSNSPASCPAIDAQHREEDKAWLSRPSPSSEKHAKGRHTSASGHTIDSVASWSALRGVSEPETVPPSTLPKPLVLPSLLSIYLLMQTALHLTRMASSSELSSIPHSSRPMTHACPSPPSVPESHRAAYWVRSAAEHFVLGKRAIHADRAQALAPLKIAPMASEERIRDRLAIVFYSWTAVMSLVLLAAAARLNRKLRLVITLEYGPLSPAAHPLQLSLSLSSWNSTPRRAPGAGTAAASPRLSVGRSTPEFAV